MPKKRGKLLSFLRSFVKARPEEPKQRELEKEKEELRGEVEALNARIGDMEVEWAQSEDRKNELEAEAQELWATKEDLEKERDEVSLYDLVVSAGADVYCVRSSRSSSARRLATTRPRRWPLLRLAARSVSRCH